MKRSDAIRGMLAGVVGGPAALLTAKTLSIPPGMTYIPPDGYVDPPSPDKNIALICGAGDDDGGMHVKWFAGKDWKSEVRSKPYFGIGDEDGDFICGVGVSRDGVTPVLVVDFDMILV